MDGTVAVVVVTGGGTGLHIESNISESQHDKRVRADAIYQ